VTLVMPEEMIQLGDACSIIGGEEVRSSSAGTLQHYFAGTGQPNGLVHLAGPEEVDAAVRRAQAAAPAWAAMSGADRRAHITRLAELVRQEADDIARITTLEMGAAAVISKWTAPMAAGWLDYYAGWADKIEGSVNPVSGVPGFDYTLREPYGVVGLIVAWNGPTFFLGMKAGPALAAGNCLVIKPSELAPYSTLRFAELALEAGIPEGVVNVVTGAAAAGDAMVRHPGIGKVSFTGSGAVARKIIESSAATVKPLTLELGGKSANLIFPDADLDHIIPHAAMLGLGLNSGQGCACGTRVIVHEAIHDEVVDRLAAFVGDLPIGDPFDEKTIIAPLVTAAAQERVCGLIDEAVADGIKLVVGGGRPGGELANGYYVEPTVFDGTAVDSRLAQTEVFGPVVAVSTFTDVADAVRQANSTEFGLAAYIATSDLSTAHRVAAALDAGSVWVNGDPQMAPSIPFGGYRASGYGREGGREGLDEYLQTKNVFIGLPRSDTATSTR
jgi:aldehyde dehydrogenase (NAD+)